MVTFQENIAGFVIKVYNAYQKWVQWRGILVAKAFITE